MTVDLTAGIATGHGTDTILNFEDVIGTWLDDTLRGNADDNRLEGFDGADTIFGAEGDDYLDGGRDNPNPPREHTDSLDGGPGHDTCIRGEEKVDCEA